MSSTVYNIAKSKALDGTLDLDGTTIKALLITGTVSIDPDHATVAAVLAAMAEANGTGYVSGVGSASRKTVTATVTTNNTNDRGECALGATSWTAVSLASTVKAVLYYQHVSGANDALNIPIAVADDASGLPLTTNGSDISLAASTIRLA